MTLCALVLAAGEGRRLRPITATIPKALCPIGNVPLLERALTRLAAHGLAGPAAVAVNASYLAASVRSFAGDRATLSVEPGPPALGTAGAIAQLRPWIGDRAVLVGNADAYLSAAADSSLDLDPLLSGWDGETVRVLCVPASDRHPAEFGPLRFAGFSLLPAAVAAALPEGPSELVHEVWRPAERAGRLELIRYDGSYVDTGTPVDFLAANLLAAGPGSSIVAASALVSGAVTASVVGAGAQVLGSVTRSVVFPGGYVGPAEDLVDAIRVGAGVTVTAAPVSG